MSNLPPSGNHTDYQVVCDWFLGKNTHSPEVMNHILSALHITTGNTQLKLVMDTTIKHELLTRSQEDVSATIDARIRSLQYGKIELAIRRIKDDILASIES